ncbi:MAG: hypothetical protein ACI4EI_00515, partial [Muricoprocola sp.]
MDYVRKAKIQDSSRLAEILIFAKRMNYREIFHNDKISFEEMQVYPLVQDYIAHPESLENIWVYDDEVQVPLFREVFCFAKPEVCNEKGA